MLKKSTKIITTISDRRCDVEFIRSLFEAGMNVVRMNSAHLGAEGMTKIVENCRAVSPRIGIIIDTKGPEIRTTTNAEPNDKIAFTEGMEVEFCGNPSEPTTSGRICLNYPDIAKDVRTGMHFLIDDGELDFLILDIIPSTGLIRARCLNDGSLGSRKSVNIPGSDIRLPALTDRDKATLATAASLGVDFVAHSFVRTADDVRTVQNELDRLGSDMKIISKIENQQGVDNFESILEASYGIMIARGDLGIEVAAERIPVIQHEMIAKCIATHHPVIVATQMLHSMITSPRPTRAEVSDIANAVYQRADCLMLSGETANACHIFPCTSGCRLRTRDRHQSHHRQCIPRPHRPLHRIIPRRLPRLCHMLPPPHHALAQHLIRHQGILLQRLHPAAALSAPGSPRLHRARSSPSVRPYSHPRSDQRHRSHISRNQFR